MFEGLPLVQDVGGIPSAHFAAENGPECVACHMPSVPVTDSNRFSHTFRPVLPGEAEDAPPDSCSACHGDLTTGDLQTLVDNTQEVVRTRLSVAFARLASVQEPEPGTASRDRYDQVVNALTFVQNDGSLGVHNYSYVDLLMNFAERTLSELSVPGADLQPTEAPAPTATPGAPLTTISAPEVSTSSGVGAVTILWIGIAVVVLLVAAVSFVRSSKKQEA
jgi:hypothetical protein